MKKKNFKRFLVIFVALVMVFTFAACGDDDGGGGSSAAPPVDATVPDTDTGAEGEAQYGGTINLIIGNTTEPFGLPWSRLHGGGHSGTPVGDTLVVERSDGTIEPWLAKTFELDLDNKEYVFELEENVTFHDGTAFNADAVIWNFQQILDHGVMNTSIAGFEKRGEYSIAIKFDAYDNALLAAIASHSYQFISPTYYEENGEEAASQTMIGTGPFKIVSYTPGGDAVLERNENYWREGEPYLDGMVFKNISDVMAQTLAVQSGEVDVLDTSKGDQIATLRESAPVYVLPMPTGVVSIFPSSAVEGSPFQKLEVRQAVNYALNRDPIIQARGFGLYTAAYQYIPEGYMGHLPEAEEVPHHDIEKAKELLAQAGYPNGFKTKLIGEFGIADEDAVTAIASQLAEVGIECELEFPDIAGSNVYRMQGGYDGMFVGRLTSFAQIYLTWLRMGVDPTYTNPGYPATWRPDDQAAIDMFEATRTSPDQAALVKANEDYHRLALENMIDIPIYNAYECLVMNEKLHGGGWGDWGTGTQYLPSQMWLEQ